MLKKRTVGSSNRVQAVVPQQVARPVAPAKPEPDYELVDFPAGQYANTKVQQPPPPPPRPPSLVRSEACGLCGGGGARVRCGECGPRALCPSCDDMYHRHPKRRHHQRQALITPACVRDERPPLPPKAAAPAPVPPPRRHKICGDKSGLRTPSLDQRRATFGPIRNNPESRQPAFIPQQTKNLKEQKNQSKLSLLGLRPPSSGVPEHLRKHLSSMSIAEPVRVQARITDVGNISEPWNRPRTSLPSIDYNQNNNMIMPPSEMWTSPDMTSPHQWGGSMRRGTSVAELGVGGGTCVGCGTAGWRYGSCASLDHTWLGGWPPPLHPSVHCCAAPHSHAPSYSHQMPSSVHCRRDSRTSSRAASRAPTRAASPAFSLRSRTSRRPKHRTPSPPTTPSSDADSEDESDRMKPKRNLDKKGNRVNADNRSCHIDKNGMVLSKNRDQTTKTSPKISSPASSKWSCEHCTFINEPDVRVCAVCCRTPNSAELNTASESGPVAEPCTSEKPINSKEDHVAAKNKPPVEESISNHLNNSSSPQDLDKEKSAFPKHTANSLVNQETTTSKTNQATNVSSPQTNRKINSIPTPVRGSSLIKTQVLKDLRNRDAPGSTEKHNICVGPSPPRGIENEHPFVSKSSPEFDKYSIKTVESTSSLTSEKVVSNTGTSPPPQDISTQTYEMPSTWSRSASVSRSRPRRRYREDTRRNRSHSRHSLSSDNRDSERSIRTYSESKREWRDDDGPMEWGGRLSRRASHQELPRPPITHFNSQAPSPEPYYFSRALSIDALTGFDERKETEKGLQLAKLLSEAERMGYNAAEVHAALAQHPAAPLVWLRERWSVLCAGVCAAAGRLAPGANVSEAEARTSLAKHKGAMWPAVNDCVDRFRRKMNSVTISEEGRLKGHVWGPPTGADDEAAPPFSDLNRADDSSYNYEVRVQQSTEETSRFSRPISNDLKQNNINTQGMSYLNDTKVDPNDYDKGKVSDSVQIENEFIEAYNALARLSPLKNIKKVDSIESIHKAEVTVTSKKDLNYNLTQNNINSTFMEDVKFLSNRSAQSLQLENGLKMKSTSDLEKSNSNDEKPTNLTEIVDNTQKMIQEMKAEINSDINSLNTSSQNEFDNISSSSEFSTDRESNFSEITNSYMEDNSISSLENNNKQKDMTNSDQSSAEDSNEFKDAADFVTDQTDDLKELNIAMLDSIARNLKEVHTASLEKTKLLNKIQHDSSKNFPFARSFEEIYDELSAPTLGSQLVGTEYNQMKNNTINVSKVYNKERIELISFKPGNPTKMLITNIKNPVHQALNFTYEDPASLTSDSYNSLPISVNIVSAEKNYENLEHNLAANVDQNSPTDADNILLLTENIIDKNSQIVKMKKEHPKTDNVLMNEKKNDNNTTKSFIPKLIRTSKGNKTFSNKKAIQKPPTRKASTKLFKAPSPPKYQSGSISANNQQFDPESVTNNNNIRTHNGETSHKNLDAFNDTSKKEVSSTARSTLPTGRLEKKKPYFSETCYTEDDLTDNDDDVTLVKNGPAENSIDQLEPQTKDSLLPATIRTVSGRVIDLTKIKLIDGTSEKQARMLLAEGAIENWDQAQLAVQLVSKGIDVPSALLAALECKDMDSALAYLKQDCELCATHFPEHEMVSMLRCTHRCCRECARHYFTVLITERSIVDCVCPYCKEPELENMSEDNWLEYFAHLDILLKTLLENHVHELFQRKLRDRTLARDPNFKWCVECSSGFFVHPKKKKLRCPECRSVSCANCRKPWSSNHSGLSCEQYAAWLEDNNPEVSLAAVHQHLRDNGIECPRCNFKYSLSRGGCMHFTCTQCKYEFCNGCGKPFTMGARCGLSEYCAKLGLHAHHPRNCLFYLRDKEPHELQTLLQMNNVSFETEAPAGSGTRCSVQLQRETPAGLVDTLCGADVPPQHAGFCKAHYVEYLATLSRGLDPIPVMDVCELVAELRRRALPLPERGPWDTDPIYAGMCAEIVKEKIPLA